MPKGTIASRRQKRRRLSILGRIVYGTLTFAFLAVLFAAGTIAGVVYSYSRNLPDINRMADFQPSKATRVYARDGELVETLYTQNRIFVPISQVPKLVQHAFVANEDHNFYTHHGVDFGGIARAAIADYRHEQFQGASTITQQLARMILADEARAHGTSDPARSFIQKAKEAWRPQARNVLRTILRCGKRASQESPLGSHLGVWVVLGGTSSAQPWLARCSARTWTYTPVVAI